MVVTEGANPAVSGRAHFVFLEVFLVVFVWVVGKRVSREVAWWRVRRSGKGGD